MEDFFLTFSLALLFLVVLCLVRVIKGPGILNRIIGVNVIGTKTMSLILLMGFIFEKIEFFIDIALVYALINFIGTLALSKYFEQRGFLRKESTR
jgi:multicomponent Na+:H+ antiporter subunit F